MYVEGGGSCGGCLLSHVRQSRGAARVQLQHVLYLSYKVRQVIAEGGVVDTRHKQVIVPASRSSSSGSANKGSKQAEVQQQ